MLRNGRAGDPNRGFLVGAPTRESVGLEPLVHRARKLTCTTVYCSGLQAGTDEIVASQERR
jgi:hypothetical protein